MLWIVFVAVVLLLVLAVLCMALLIRRQRTGAVPVDVYRLLVAWRSAQCKAEIRAAAGARRRQLWAELDEIDRRERGQP